MLTPSCPALCPATPACQLPGVYWDALPPSEWPEIPAPTVSALDPNSAEVGSRGIIMKVTGTNFTPNSRIVFNGGEEQTTFVSATELRTLVRPWTASGPWTVPVTVRTEGRESGPVNFSFTEPPAPDEE